MENEGKRALEALQRLLGTVKQWSAKALTERDNRLLRLCCDLVAALEEPEAASPWQRGWKGLRRDAEGRLWSMVAGSAGGMKDWWGLVAQKMPYAVGGQTVFGPTQPGTWFAERADAEAFLAGRPGCVLAEVEVQECEPPGPVMGAPQGTRFATAIRVVEPVCKRCQGSGWELDYPPTGCQGTVHRYPCPDCQPAPKVEPEVAPCESEPDVTRARPSMKISLWEGECVVCTALGLRAPFVAVPEEFRGKVVKVRIEEVEG